MADLNAIFREYTKMRVKGVESKAALNMLRHQIEGMTKQARDVLAYRIREWEANEERSEEDEVGVRTEFVSPIKPLQPPPAPPQPPQPKPSGIRKITIAPSPTTDAMELGSIQGKYDTRMLPDESSRVREDYFGDNFVLQMILRDEQEAFEMRPQNFAHEIVLGRVAGDNPVRPDIDLTSVGGAELGVSRLHMGLRYDPDHHAIHVYDLGSANGSYINNQRLNPREVRFLRDGDQLRLGRLVMMIRFLQG